MCSLLTSDSQTSTPRSFGVDVFSHLVILGLNREQNIALASANVAYVFLKCFSLLFLCPCTNSLNMHNNIHLR